ncbi:MAG: DNA cytosine methyltransferase [Hormoscilla sp. SP5CHS1]|nr:DNA cytosine methyltransferase [Hormoscilla sp. SP12CHS1]MBC6455468.1 DNA cytosine methyltransferase [Hormoscilla sp. SP5CHS1]
MSISVVELFRGAGGLTYGFEQAGLLVKAGYDIDPECRFPYEHNTGARFFLRDVQELEGADIAEHFFGSAITVLAGCAPCQPFSTYSRRYDDRQSKWLLMQEFARLVEESNPDIAFLENVLPLKFHPVFKKFTAHLARLNYFVKHYRVNCPDYGVPQSRKRLVLFASKFGEIGLFGPTHTP